MAAFEYEALDAEGRTQRGVLQGDTARNVRQILRERGLSPFAVSEVREIASRKFLRRGLSSSQLALLTRQLATLLKAGLPIDEVLAALGEEVTEESLRALLVGLRSRVMEGASLAVALAEYPETFSDIFRSSVAAGEQSGKLEQVLERLADYSEARDQLKQKIWAALAYPLLLTLVALGVVIGLLAYIVPQVVGVFMQMHQRLPWPTEVLLALSEGLKSFGWFLLLFSVLIIVGLRLLWRRESLRYRWHKLLLGLPLIGRLVRAANTARGARTLALLSASAVPLLESLTVAAPVIPNLPMREAIQRAAIKVREGSTFSKALAESGYFPPIALRLIASGERSG